MRKLIFLSIVSMLVCIDANALIYNPDNLAEADGEASIYGGYGDSDRIYN